MTHFTRTWATSRRILSQLRHDHQTVALMLLVPVLLMVLMRFVFDSALAFDRIAPKLLGLFPYVVMFLVTSVTMLRERTTGTLERLMTTPLGRVDLLLGYAIAFGLIAVIQVVLVIIISLTWLGLSVAGSVPMLLLIAVFDALLGMATGLLVSAFARTEFQAVQFMPAIVMPQAFLCGLFVPRDHMAGVLRRLSDFIPLSYAVDGLTRVSLSSSMDLLSMWDLAIMVGCTILALLLGAATLRRRTV
ncbi:MAG: ABC transporter permease [Burkholderiaceae bacterium]